MVHDIRERVPLNNGVMMPWLGLGMYKLTDEHQLQQAIQTALEAGYRGIDTATLYANEAGVGQAMRDCGLPREDLFVTTKLWNADQGYETTLQGFEASRKRLQVDYVDLYLIHWPVKGKYKETWRALEKLYKDGFVRAIGVSNFLQHHLQDVLDDAEIRPSINQIEYHPYLTQESLRNFCAAQGIRLEAWSPLMRGRMLDEPVLRDMAAQHGKTTAQVVLRWDLQHGVVTIPKSVQPSRIRENANIFDFELSVAEMARIDALDRHERCGPDPDNFNF